MNQRPVPTSQTTLFYGDWKGGRLRGQPFTMVPITVDEFMAEVAAFPQDRVPVAYLARPLRFVQLNETMVRWLATSSNTDEVLTGCIHRAVYADLGNNYTQVFLGG
jgi:hypothetical protein